jgi:glycosyltransferase involved in cell wall biosynthesis
VTVAAPAAAEWVAAWRRRLERAPRVLHLGNIANNAYLNAKMLRSSGVEADVLCCDYYHIMGCPEWEDADLTGDHGSDDLPDWNRVDLRGFRRPDWFVQGPSTLCLAYLSAMQQGKSRRAAALRKGLAISMRPRVRRTAEPFLALRRRARSMKRSSVAHPGAPTSGLMSRAQSLSDAFVEAFPGRADRPTADDLVPLVAAYAPFQSILGPYDLVHAYATQGLLPLVAGRPYVVYEHGTIRGLPFRPEPLWQLCALSYRMADHVFITNADAVLAARKLGLERITFVPHPVNEDHLAPDAEAVALRQRVRAELDADFVVFHPSRQDWTAARDPVWEKGNDVFLRGFARFVNEVSPRAAAVLVDWGRSVEASRNLAAELGIASRIRWIAPQPNRSMVRWIHATDLVADQFLVGAFGGITPKAMACGRPVMLKLDEELHRWCFPEAPPVLNTGDEHAVFDALRRTYLHPEAARDLADRSRDWYRRHHSNEVVLERLLSGYASVVERAASRPGPGVLG